MKQELEPAELTYSRRQFLKFAGILSAASVLGLLSVACTEEQKKQLEDLQKSQTPEKTNKLFVPENYSSSRFLTLPFSADPEMQIQQGWFYNFPDKNGNPAKHQGLDFIKGLIDYASTWKPFEVLAAADGWAVCNPPSRQGNAVFIRHQAMNKDIYTYYGHLATIAPGIPLYNNSDGTISKGIPVRRGDKIGVAGATGVLDEQGNPQPTWIHLHFGVLDIDVYVDPYGEYGQRDVYPDPNFTNGKTLGNNALWKNG